MSRMDLLRIKKIYDERFRGNPSALEKYVCDRLSEVVFRESGAKGIRKVAVKGKGVKVVFEWDDAGHIIDMRFE